jgi:hypothetical protein
MMDDWVVLYQVDEFSLRGKADLKGTDPRHVFALEALRCP